MGAITTLTANLEMNSARYRQEADRATRQTQRFRREVAKTNGNVVYLKKSFQGAAQGIAAIDGPLGGVSSRISSVNSLVTSGALKWAGLGAAIAGTTYALWKSVAVAEETERQQLKQQALLRATGMASGKTVEILDSQARAVARNTLASTDGIREAQNVLLTFRSISGPVFDQAIKLSQDLAAVMGGTAKSSALQLAKALEDPKTGLTALRRAGVSFTEQEKEVIQKLHESGEAAKAQGLILAKLSAQVGGAGTAEAGGLSGSFDTLGQSVSEFLEKVDNKLGTSTALTGFVNGLAGAVDSLSESVSPSVSNEKEFVTLTERKLELQEKIAELDRNRFTFSGFFMGNNEQILNAESEIEAINRRINELQQERISQTQAEQAAQDEQLRVQREALEQKRLEKAEIEEQERVKAEERRIAEEEKQQERIERELEQLDYKLASEEEKLRISYENRSEIIRQAEEKKIRDADVLREMQARNEEKFKRDQQRLEEKNKKKDQGLDKNHWAMKLKGAAKYFGDMTGLSLSGSKTLFKIQKAAALAQAIVATPAAVAEAIKNGGGLPWGAIPGAITLAHQLSQIAAIKSAEFDAGGGGSAAGGAASGGDFSPASVEPEALTPEQDPEALQRTVRVHWDVQDGDMIPARSAKHIYDQLLEQNNLKAEFVK